MRFRTSLDSDFFFLLTDPMLLGKHLAIRTFSQLIKQLKKF